MSEYQFFHFLSCDRALSDAELRYMRGQSSRARVSRREFTNEYDFGDFHGNTHEMLRRGYDAHLHFANFGARTLMFRLPAVPGGESTFASFAVEHQLTWTKDKRGKAGILTIAPGEDVDHWQDHLVDDLREILAQVAPLRASLLRGDLRALYIAWLACESNEDAVEPPVPAGLGQLDGSLKAQAQFHEIPSSLLKIAASAGGPAPKDANKNLAVDKWIRGLKKEELQRIVRDLANGGDAARVQATLLADARRAHPMESWPMARGSRTRGELHALGEAAETIQRAKRKRAEDRAHAKRLAAIAQDPRSLIARINSLVAHRTMRDYHAAADCLDELALALGESRGPAKSRAVAARLRKRKSSSRVLVGVLRKRGWIA